MLTYSTTLDDVDLALMPLPRQPGNSFLKKELYQFHVMKTDLNEAAAKPILYTCHICAIDVPAAFASEHAASQKHRANVRIASVAAERMRVHISALPPPHAAQTSKRFCANCSMEVGEDHEKTNEHRVAVMLDNLLWDLMRAYVHDHDDTTQRTDESKKKSEVNDKQEEVNLATVDENCNNTNNNINNTKALFINKNLPIKLIEEGIEQNEEIKKNCHNNITLEKSSEDNNTENDNQSETESNVTRKHSLKSDKDYYGEELRKFINDKELFEYKEITKISIKFKDSIINNIDSDHYHSYDRANDDGNVICIVCDCVLNNEDSEAHKYDLKHIRRVANLGKGGHYIREINELYGHCILCNLKIDKINLVTHTQSATHSLKEYLYTNTRPDNLKEHIGVEGTTDKKITNNELDYSMEDEVNDNVDYSGVLERYEEHTEYEEPSDNPHKYNNKKHNNMKVYGESNHLIVTINDSSDDYSENGDPITFLQYLEQYCENEESGMSIDDDSSNFTVTIDDSSEESSNNENSEDSIENYCENKSLHNNLEKYSKSKEPNHNITEYAVISISDLDSRKTKESPEYSTKKYSENEKSKTYFIHEKSDLDECNITEKPEYNLTEYIEKIVPSDNEEEYYKDEDHEDTLEEYDTSGESEDSWVEKLNENLEESSENDESNISIHQYGENRDPITYLQYLEQYCKNDESIILIDDSSNFEVIIGDTSEEYIKNENPNVINKERDEKPFTNLEEHSIKAEVDLGKCIIKDGSDKNMEDNRENKGRSNQDAYYENKELKDNQKEPKQNDNIWKPNENTDLKETQMENKYNLQKYGEEIRKCLDDKESFEFNETFNTVEIRIKEYTLKTYSNRFHGFNTLPDKNTIRCLVCDCIFKCEDGLDHKYDLKHIRKIAGLGKDGHYIREIDETYSHCILCNVKIENTNVAAHKDLFSHQFGKRLFTRNTAKKNNEIQHALMTIKPIKKCKPDCNPEAPSLEDKHQLTDQKVVVVTNSDKITKAKVNNAKDYGDELRKYIDSKYNFEYHEKSKVIRIKINDNVISIYNDNFHSYDRTYFSKKLVCLVCDCYLKLEDADNHKYDLKHMQRIVNIGNDQHYIREINESYSHCILCNVKIKNEILDSHKLLLLHTIKKDLYTSNEGNIKIEATNAKIEKKPQSVEVSNERNKINETTVKQIDTIVGVGNKTEDPYEATASGKLRCVVCDCQVPNSVKNKEEHVNGFRHRHTIRYRYA